ncbi:hypothetical protein SAMN05192559_107199 [Halobacillus karajensis]|uniref:Uncharacterized protein n=1 Tax=Halobacillus karajensis TaxID=195088 RepID=A0A024P9I8_9BACI|nr:hypothetical protein BN982_02568 [Halobacillus karajensis]CDQ25092.1 hypothetical protein BN983_03397 [Halobacillus karajensis]CDQ28547.1 hypothetical protein BN981_02855 [Halobacillus karajensis]SEI02385.1 hypothetical protein SAMN05192559_107199 [Halobacillus karajensis]
MEYALLFGILLTLLPLATIRKIKGENWFQRVLHIGCLLVGMILLLGFAIQFTDFIGEY